MKIMTFPEFMNKKYLEWQLEKGRKTIIEFAAYIGVSQPILSMWMNGKKRPGTKNIELLAEIFGIEVYDSLGMERPNPYLQKIEKVWEFVPQDIQRKIAEDLEVYETQNEQRRLHKVSKQKKTGET